MQQQQAKQQQRQQQQQQQLQHAQQKQRKSKEFQMEDAYYEAREINGLSELTTPEYGQKQMRFNKQPQHQQQYTQQNSLLTTHNLPKSSFRGNIKYSQNNGNTYAVGGNKYSDNNNHNNNNNHNYQYKSNSSSSSSSSSNKNKNNIGYSISNQIGGTNDRNLNSRNHNSNNSNNHSHNNNSQSKHSSNKGTSSNANNLDNDELKDYKSKIKNKYNIDYDHSLDDEYEIIEAIE